MPTIKYSGPKPKIIPPNENVKLVLQILLEQTKVLKMLNSPTLLAHVATQVYMPKEESTEDTKE